jgi:DNA polymerase-4
MDRVILHCDCNSYFASVESIGHPELRKVPMAVCGDPDSRHGIILAKNELAKKFGVATAETIWQAKRKCPQLVLVPPHGDKYEEYCTRINEIYAQYTDQVESSSIDESYLDVTGSRQLFGTGQKIADTLRRRVWEELELTISVGVSFNKLFAKMGSDYKKPNATTVITRDNFKRILYPLPVEAMMYVGKAATEVLRKNFITTIGELANTPAEHLKRLLGVGGESLWQQANGLDESQVLRPGEGDPVKSVGNGITFCRDLTGLEDIKAGLLMLCDSVGARLRHHGLMARSIALHIKDPALKTISRQVQLPGAVSTTRELYEAALPLLCRSWNVSSPIRTLTVTAGNLCMKEEGGSQVSLFPPEALRQEKQVKLEEAIDGVRSRYGREAVTVGTVLSSDVLNQKN